MAKKAVSVTPDYLEQKINDLEERKRKVISVIEQYTEVYKRIEGALEMLNSMKVELSKEVEEPDKKE